jgi:hypothetical protein
MTNSLGESLDMIQRVEEDLLYEHDMFQCLRLLEAEESLLGRGTRRALGKVQIQHHFCVHYLQRLMGRNCFRRNQDLTEKRKMRWKMLWMSFERERSAGCFVHSVVSRFATYWNPLLRRIVVPMSHRYITFILNKNNALRRTLPTFTTGASPRNDTMRISLSISTCMYG